MPANASSFMFVFPGQGSQYRGMGSDLHREFAVARKVYDRASEALGFDIAELSFRDPEAVIGRTAYTQPALLTHSIACLEVFRDLTDGAVEPEIAAGHSLGEYSALVAAGALDLEDAVRLVRRRGELMSEQGAGKMLAVPMAVEDVRPFAERHYCGIGGCNLPNQTVVGGLEEDLEALVEELKETQKRIRTTLLDTEGAFHTYLMVEAARLFRDELRQIEFRQPRCRLVSNFTGDFHDPDPIRICYHLFFQLFNPVRWIWGVERALESGVGAIIEFGGGLGGEEDSPATKRPNLASIIQRTIKARRGRFGRRTSDISALGYSSLYAPAINHDTVRAAAHLATALLRLRGAAGDESRPQLVVPTIGGVPVAAATEILQQVEELGLGDRVEMIAAEADESDKQAPRLSVLDAEGRREVPADAIGAELEKLAAANS
jgi:malonyl CoA-acyl carrier protein transacylase